MSKEDREAIQKTLSLMMDAIQSIKGEMEQRFSYYDEQILNVKSNVVKLEQGYQEIINNSNVQQPEKGSNLQQQMNEMTSKFQLLKSQLDAIMLRSQSESEHIKQKKEQRRVILPKTSSLDSPLKSLNNVKATMGANEREAAIIGEEMEIAIESKSGIKLTPAKKTTLDIQVDEKATEKVDTVVKGKTFNIPPPPAKNIVSTNAIKEKTFPASRSQTAKTLPVESKDGKTDDKSELMKALKQLESI
ncbi:MAG: hypothetical protein ACTSYA_06240 [Candidatus Kariarchaeaceae archaeon]